MSESPSHIKRYFIRRFFSFVIIVSLVVPLIVAVTLFGINSPFATANWIDWLTGKKPLLEESASGINPSETVRVVSEESAVIEAVKKASGAVVSVIVSEDVPVFERYYEESPFSEQFGPQFDPFGVFKGFEYRVPKYRQKGTENKRVSAGTGFMVSADGYVVTNKHVVANEKATYTVIMNDTTKYTAQVLARDLGNDIAVLRIDGKEDFPFLELGDSNSLEVGQTAIAIGYALGKFDNSVSKGVISGLYRSIDASGGVGTQAEHLEGIIQTDAAINPGNSGGPLLNIGGQVIGMNVAILEGSENIGFAIPINDVRSVYESVRNTGRIVRPFLGVRYVLIDEDFQKRNNLSVNYGALIIRGETAQDLAIIPGSPADKADLEENDIILEVDGAKVNIENSLALLLRKKNVGDTVKLKVLREGNEKEVLVVLEELKSEP
jgi:serine protease Do